VPQDLPELSGLERELHGALINLLALLLLSPELDVDVARRAQWLKWKLEGFDPAAQLPVQNPFVVRRAA
jgi:hypothetical protein